MNAETLLRTLRDSDASRPATWTALGCAYAVMARPDDARQALRQGAQLLQTAGKPDDPLISYARGYVEFWYAPRVHPFSTHAVTKLTSTLQNEDSSARPCHACTERGAAKPTARDH